MVCSIFWKETSFHCSLTLSSWFSLISTDIPFSLVIQNWHNLLKSIFSLSLVTVLSVRNLATLLRLTNLSVVISVTENIFLVWHSLTTSTYSNSLMVSKSICSFLVLPRDAMLARYTLSSCVRLSVRPACHKSVFFKMAEHRIVQTTPYDSPGTLVCRRLRSRQNSNGVIPMGAQIEVG